MSPSNGRGEVDNRYFSEDLFDKRRAAMLPVFRIGAMDSDQKFGHGHRADKGAFQLDWRRKHERHALLLKVVEYAAVDHPSHGSVSGGNSERMSRRSFAKLSASSPRQGSF